MKTKILVVDDERDLLELLKMNLEPEGYTVITAETGARALETIKENRPDLVLLDIMLEDTSGITITGQLKNNPYTADIPIILLTAKDTDTDIVVGLKVGADDYITKPFSTQVLVARMEAVLRRFKPPIISEKGITIGPARIIPQARMVLVDEKPVDLTGGEYDILWALVEAAGKILTRQQLKESLTLTEGDQSVRVVDVHIGAMRKKLGKARKIIKTVHNRGYRINP